MSTGDTNTNNTTVTPTAEPNNNSNPEKFSTIINQYGIKPEDVDVIVSSKVEEARRTEKAKLYDDIEKQKNEITRLQNAIKEKEKEIDTVKTSTLSDEEKTRAELSKLTESVLSLNNKLAQQEENNRRLQLDNFRAQKILELKQNNVGFIESLIGGDSEQAILASVEKAKKVYEESENAFREKYKVDATVPPPVNPSTRAGVGQVPQSDEDRLAVLKKELDGLNFMNSTLSGAKATKERYDMIKKEMLEINDRILKRQSGG